MIGDELGAFARAVIGMLERALPFQDRPSGVVVAGELGEDPAEIDLPVAERAESAGAVEPALEPAIDALSSSRPELGILHVKGADPLVVDVDELEIVELLDHIVARVVEDAAPIVVVEPLEEHLEGHAVVDVLARMDLKADIDARFVEGIEK